MFIKKVSKTNINRAIIFIFIIIAITVISCLYIFNFTKPQSNEEIPYPNTEEEAQNTIEEYVEESEKGNETYIKWVDFKGTASVLSKLSKLDITSHQNNEDVKFNWIELMSYLACKYGGDFSKFKQSDLDTLTNKLKSGETIENLSKDYKLYNYYYESYDAIFHEYIGNYTMQTTDENGNKVYKTNYGLKVFSPIAKGYSFSHYKDFGTARSYGYRRVHLGNDLLRKYWNSYNSC